MRRNGRVHTGVDAKRRRARIARRLQRPGPPRGEVDVKLDARGAIIMSNGSFDEPLKCMVCQARREAAVAAGHRRYSMCSSCIGTAAMERRSWGFSEKRRCVPAVRTDFARWRPGAIFYRQISRPLVHPHELGIFRAIKADLDRELIPLPFMPKAPSVLTQQVAWHLAPDEVLVSTLRIMGGSQEAIDAAIADALASGEGFCVRRADWTKAEQDLANGAFVRLRPRP